MSAAPFSVLNACKMAASILGIPWSKAQPVYRELQHSDAGEPLLPLSSGRSICFAEATHVARFLVATALCSTSEDLGVLVRSFMAFRPLNAMYSARWKDCPYPTLEQVLADGLSRGWEVDVAGGKPHDGIEHVTFNPDDDRPKAWVEGFGLHARDMFQSETDNASVDHLGFRPYVERSFVEKVRDDKQIKRSIELSGYVFYEMSRRVLWRNAVSVSESGELK